eukprot:3227486-Amphidinium_carterae.1
MELLLQLTVKKSNSQRFQDVHPAVLLPSVTSILLFFLRSKPARDRAEVLGSSLKSVAQHGSHRHARQFPATKWVRFCSC